jgi:hypothetical protein
MNMNCAWPALRTALLLGGFACSLRAADWTTTDGKVYHEVKIIHLEPDTVTILYAEGGARIPLAHLPADLQKRFGYDAVLAQAAADAHAKETVENAKALQAEMNEASSQRQAGPVPTATDTPTATTDSPVRTDVSPSKPASGSGTDYFVDGITFSALSLRSDPTDTTHYSMDQLTLSAAAMRPKLSDPTYHTMAHLVYTVNSQGLGPDLSDPKHHTMKQATGGQ